MSNTWNHIQLQNYHSFHFPIKHQNTPKSFHARKQWAEGKRPCNAWQELLGGEIGKGIGLMLQWRTWRMVSSIYMDLSQPILNPVNVLQPHKLWNVKLRHRWFQPALLFCHTATFKGPSPQHLEPDPKGSITRDKYAPPVLNVAKQHVCCTVQGGSIWVKSAEICIWRLTFSQK